MELNFKEVAEAVTEQMEQRERKRAIRVHSFASKMNNMKEELPVLKEVAKLLFEINENLKEVRARIH